MSYPRLHMPPPPIVTDQKYANASALARDLADWAVRATAVLHIFSNGVVKPLGQQFQVGSFTTNTTITGTSTGTAVANYLASLTQAMQDRGFVSPVYARTNATTQTGQ